MGCCGFIIIFGLNVNMSVAIVAMVNHTAVNQNTSTTSENDYVGDLIPIMSKNSSTMAFDTEDGPFIWNGQTQGLILGSYYWGFIITQIPGGILAETLGIYILFCKPLNCMCLFYTKLIDLVTYYHF